MTKQTLSYFGGKTRDEVMKEWVGNLRSGEYQQGQGFLHHSDSYCCLGVLCDMSVKDTEYEWKSGFIGPDSKVKHFEEHYVCPPDKMLDELNISMKANKLMKMNDSGKTFSEIADYIEQYCI